MDQETHRIQQEQQQCRDQMVDLLPKFGEEVKKVEELRVQVEKPIEMSIKKETWGVRLVTEENNLMTRMTTSTGETKISKPPQICLFSGNKLVSRDEGNVDQWELQAQGALVMHTENSVHAAIVNSLRGPTRDLVGFIGFDADLKRILEESCQSIWSKIHR